MPVAVARADTCSGHLGIMSTAITRVDTCSGHLGIIPTAVARVGTCSHHLGIMPTAVVRLWYKVISPALFSIHLPGVSIFTLTSS